MILKVGHLIDPATSSVVDGRYISIEDHKIVAIDSVAPQGQGRVIDLSALWVLPGFFDAHTHLTYNYDSSLCAAYLEDGSGARALIGLHEAQAMLRAGFTTVRDVGNAGNYVDTDLRRAIDKGLFQGPTIINAGKIIAPFGGQSDAVSPEEGTCWKYEYLDADGPDQVRQAVRQNIFYGALVIKMLSDPRGGLHGIYSREEFDAAVSEAHRDGRAVAVHAKTDATAMPAIEAGVDSIEHGYYLSEAALTAMAKRGIFLVPTDQPLIDMGGPRDAAAKRFAGKVERLRNAYRLGVPLAFGSDDTEDERGLDRGQMMADYLPIWEQAGIPRMVILRAMTSDAARLLRVSDERGRIAVGQDADIVGLGADPLAGLGAIRDVRFVMKEGQEVELATPTPLRARTRHRRHREI